MRTIFWILKTITDQLKPFISPPFLGCKGCRQERTEPCQLHGPHQTFKLTKTVNNNNNINNSVVGLPNAVESFPNEVGLCISGIPGVGYGVCAKQTIPLGTWIGPYEGELVRPEEVPSGTDTSYMWEVNYFSFYSSLFSRKNLFISQTIEKNFFSKPLFSPELSNTVESQKYLSYISFINSIFCRLLVVKSEYDPRGPSGGGALFFLVSVA